MYRVTLRLLEGQVMSKVIALLVVVIALASSACANSYRQQGMFVKWRGGYSDYKVTLSKFHVDYRTNNFTDPSLGMQYAFRRASEIAVSEGKPCFQVLQAACGEGDDVAVIRVAPNAYVSRRVGHLCSLDFKVVDSCDVPDAMPAIVTQDE
jgi:hypothetical protein